MPENETSIEKTIQYIDSAGHSLSNDAYIIDDDLFGGDAVFATETIEKYGLLYVVDPKKAIQSLEDLAKKNFSAMIPGHGQSASTRQEALDMIHGTKEHYENTTERILSIIGEGMDFKDYTKKVMKEYELAEALKARGGVTQYFLFQTSIMAYLSNLMDEKKVKFEMERYDLKIKTEN